MLLILDMDGVLIDSEQHWRSIESDFLRELIPQWSEVDQRGILGMSLRDVYKRLCASYSLSLTWESYLRHYDALGERIYRELATVTPGATELLAATLKAGHCCAVASSSPRHWIDMVLDRFELRPIFSTIASSDDVNGIGKPDPAVYRFCLTKSCHEPRQSVAVEDSDKGLMAARGAQILTIGFRNGQNDHQHFADAEYVVSSFAELTPDRLIEMLDSFSYS